MKTINSSIPVNETFRRLMTGATTLDTVLAERHAARTSRLASEDPVARRRREQVEAADPFTLNNYR